MRKTLNSLLVLIVAVLVFSFFVPRITSALGLPTPGITSIFGGKIILITPCIGPNFSIYVLGPKPGRFIFNWTPPNKSTLYKMYQPLIGNNVIGTTSGMTTCLGIPSPTIKMIGTSGL